MIRRHATQRLLDALSDTPIVHLQGARQTGKSTLAQSIATGQRPRTYLTLDTFAVRAAAQADPEGFIAGLDGPAVIDEVQRAPDLALAIKAAVDADRRAGQFLLTGSAGILSLPKLSESLAGRMEIHTLWPFSQGEISGTRETFIDRVFADELSTAAARPQQTIIERLCVGGYPEALARETATRRHAWFDSYLDAIIQRDIRDLANIERLSEVPRLLALLASRAGQVINHADLSRSLAIPQTTLKRYMALLETTFILRFLPAWFTNIGKRLTKTPKLLLTDSGLLLHLLGADGERLATDRTLFGHVLENFTVMEVIKQLGWSDRRCRPYHFRVESGAEVDLVLEDSAGGVVGIEVKSAVTLRSEDMRGLKALAGIAGPRFVRGIILYGGTATVPFGERLHALPINQLWT